MADGPAIAASAAGGTSPAVGASFGVAVTMETRAAANVGRSSRLDGSDALMKIAVKTTINMANPIGMRKKK